MKVYKSEFPTIEVAVLLFANIGVGVLLMSILNVTIVSTLVSTLGYLIIGSSMTNFTLGSSRFYVKRTWLPWGNKYIEYEDIRKIYIRDILNIGMVLTIELKDSRVKGWSSNIKRKQLEELVLILKTKCGLE